MSRPLSATKNYQQGIGLIEVLVALLLLAVAALGYAALQTRALRSTDEALIRTQALTILNSATEKIRTNGLQNNYTVTTTIPASGTTPASSTTTTHQIIEYYAQLLNTAGIPTVPACLAASNCTGDQIYKAIAAQDVKDLKTVAQASDIKLGAVICPATTGKGATNCLVAAWGNTNPTMGSGASDCMKTSGTYNFTAECVYMESY